MFLFLQSAIKVFVRFSILLIVLRVEERAVSRTPVVHVWHLGGAPWLTTELLGAVPPAASVVVTGRTATHVIELGRVVEDEVKKVNRRDDTTRHGTARHGTPTLPSQFGSFLPQKCDFADDYRS